MPCQFWGSPCSFKYIKKTSEGLYKDGDKVLYLIYRYTMEYSNDHQIACPMRKYHTVFWGLQGSDVNQRNQGITTDNSSHAHSDHR